MSRVFGLLGTPSEQNWPSWEIMPDAGKLIFEERPPLKDWSTISLDSAEGKKLSVLVTDASPELLKFLKLMLKLDTFQRASAQSLLENNWMKVSKLLSLITVLSFLGSISQTQLSDSPTNNAPLLPSSRSHPGPLMRQSVDCHFMAWTIVHNSERGRRHTSKAAARHCQPRRF